MRLALVTLALLLGTIGEAKRHHHKKAPKVWNAFKDFVEDEFGDKLDEIRDDFVDSVADKLNDFIEDN